MVQEGVILGGFIEKVVHKLGLDFAGSENGKRISEI